MDIGEKLRQARQAAALTQEQAAEALHVSRQTISNWETGKTWPDIVSVVRMSELYAVSLDRLLKGEEEPVSAYVDYLGESADAARSREKLARVILWALYGAVWAGSLLVFWFGTDPGDAMGYSLAVLWLLLPLATLIVSFFLGRWEHTGRSRWLAPPLLGLGYMLAEYGSFSAANMAAFHKWNAPQWGMLFAGALLSLVGLAAGTALRRRREKKK